MLLRSGLGRDRRCLSGAAGAVPQHQAGPEGGNDARTGMPARMLAGAMCVQRLDDSLNSAIRITYRISLRSSSMLEPRDPLLKVLTCFHATRRCHAAETELRAAGGLDARRTGPGARRGNVSVGSRGL
jgi:hypothetical protein